MTTSEKRYWKEKQLKIKESNKINSKLTSSGDVQESHYVIENVVESHCDLPFNQIRQMLVNSSFPCACPSARSLSTGMVICRKSQSLWMGLGSAHSQLKEGGNLNLLLRTGECIGAASSGCCWRKLHAQQSICVYMNNLFSILSASERRREDRQVLSRPPVEQVCMKLHKNTTHLRAWPSWKGMYIWLYIMYLVLCVPMYNIYCRRIQYEEDGIYNTLVLINTSQGQTILWAVDNKCINLLDMRSTSGDWYKWYVCV